MSIDGLISGLDTTSIIEGLVALQEQQIDRLNVRRDEILVEQTAFQGIEARLTAFRSTLGQLNRSANSVFEASSGTSSDEDILTVSAGGGAAEASYVVRVNSLARAQQLSSQGFDRESTTISEGTISFRVGDNAATEITIDESNNTVNGLVDAINVQSDDISASIVRDQANGTDRILLTSRLTGAANEIEITNNLGAAGENVVRPDFSGPPVQEASNAAIQLGSGPGAIIAEFDTNTVDELIEDVTLNLSAADVDREVTINVERDTEAAEETIRRFVDEYNGIVNFIDQQTQFNPDTGVGSPLIGNRSVANLENTLSALVTEAVPGLDSSLNRFSQIGISIGAQGQLSLDSAQLSDALDGNIEGVEPTDIQRLFGLSAESSSSNIQFLLGSSRTEASTEDYQVDITQAAEQGSIIAGTSLASSIVIDGTNNGFQISIDGVLSEELTLEEGTYTPEELAAQLEAQINASEALDRREVAVSIEGGALEITSLVFGERSEVSELSGSALSVLGFDGSESGQGQDVAGHFIVDGVIETATGTGRLLIGDIANANTADLQLRISLDADQIEEGPEGSLSVSRGVTSRLDQYFETVLDPETGTVRTVNDNFELRLESLDASIQRVNEISEARSASLVEQFTILERTLSELQSTSSFLASQLASL